MCLFEAFIEINGVNLLDSSLNLTKHNLSLSFKMFNKFFKVIFTSSNLCSLFILPLLSMIQTKSIGFLAEGFIFLS